MDDQVKGWAPVTKADIQATFKLAHETSLQVPLYTFFVLVRRKSKPCVIALGDKCRDLIQNEGWIPIRAYKDGLIVNHEKEIKKT